MGLLDTLLDRFLQSEGFDEIRDPVQVEGREANGRTAGAGNTFVLKQDPNTGQLVRLERPERNPLAFFEREDMFEQPQQFSQALQEPEEEGFNILNSLGEITGFGSSLWGQGLDIDLNTGDPVQSPISGIIESVGERGGFGNQVRIRDPQNRSWWLSHLSAANVQPGQRVRAGQPIGTGGATGNVIDLGGGGSHLDVSVKEGDRFLSPNSIADMLRSFG